MVFIKKKKREKKHKWIEKAWYFYGTKPYEKKIIIMEKTKLLEMKMKSSRCSSEGKKR